jgi:glycosyltransferase involved in cell wall biosynthesis
MGEELAAFRPDVVHLVNPFSMGYVGLKRAREVGAPVLASYHTDIPGYLQKYGFGLFTELGWSVFRWLHNQADLNVCPTLACREELEEHGFERVEIWGRGVDSELYHPGRRSRAWRERLTEGHPEAPLLVYVGRLAHEKRVDVVRPVLDELPHARLAIVGDGPLRDELDELFAGTNTVFTGYLRGDDLAAAYAAGDVFVFPGENETFGNVVLEAMASGLPVLAAGIGGPRDHVHSAQNGFLFEPGNSAQLVTLVRWLLMDEAFRLRLASNARAYAEGQTWESILDGLVGKYERLAAARVESEVVASSA